MKFEPLTPKKFSVELEVKGYVDRPEVIVELRDPHSWFRVVGYMVSLVTQYPGVEPSRKLEA